MTKILSLTLLAASLLAAGAASAKETYLIVAPLRSAKAATAPTQPPAPELKLTLAGGTLPVAPLNRNYSADLKPFLTITGGDGAEGGAASWSLVGGTLPTGLSLTSGGVLSGIATVAGSSTVTVRAAYNTAMAEQSYALSAEDLGVDFSALMVGFDRDAVVVDRVPSWSTALGGTYYWTSRGPTYGGPVGVIETRRAVYSSKKTTGVIKYLVDDDLTHVYVNGVVRQIDRVGDASVVRSSNTFTLERGINVVAVTFENVGSYGGFVAEIRDATTGVVLAPASGWKIR